MNLPPELAGALRPVGLLAVEVTLLVALAALAHRWVRSPSGRSGLWQGCLLAILVLLAAELFGVGRHLKPLRTTASPLPTSLADALSASSTRDGYEPPAPAVVGSSRDPSPGIADAGLSDRGGPGGGALQLREDFRRQVSRRLAEARSEPGRSPPAPGSDSFAASAAADSPGASWAQTPDPSWVALGWTLGAGLLLLRAMMARLLTASFRFRSRPVSDAGLLTVVRALARRLGFRASISLRTSSRLRGPIAFGLWRPTVVLPTGFTRDFPGPKRDAVLAHEVAHLVARDPLWYFLADVAGAFLWWHPLVWWARSRFHRASETAADAASVVVMDGPRVLAECLVELGNRLTRRESLGWLGVAGFRSSLGRRVEHLLSLNSTAWAPPTRPRPALAKTVGASAVGAVILFGSPSVLPQALTKEDNMQTIRYSWKQSLAALALLASPGVKGSAAESPAPATPPPVSETAPAPPGAIPAPTPAPAPAGQNTPAVDPRLAQRYGLGPASSAPSSGDEMSPDLQRAFRERYGIAPPSAGSPSGTAPAGVRGGRRFGGGGFGGMGPGSALEGKLMQMVFDEVSFDGIPLPEVVKFLADQAQRRDPDKHGINFLINPNVTAAPPPAPLVDPVTGNFIPAPTPEAMDMNSVIIRITPPLRNVRLKDVLDAVVKVADRPIQYSVEDYAVVFSQNREAVPSGAESASPAFAARPLAVRTFRVDTNNFAAGLEYAFDIRLAPAGTGTDGTRSKQMRSALRQLLTQLGIGMDVPGKAVFYNELTGVIMVRATPEDLEIVNAAVETLGGAPQAPGLAVPQSGMAEAMRQRYGLPSVRR